MDAARLVVGVTRHLRDGGCVVNLRSEGLVNDCSPGRAGSSLTGARRCQRPRPGNRRDKDAQCCAAALTLRHFSRAASQKHAVFLDVRSLFAHRKHSLLFNISIFNSRVG